MITHRLIPLCLCALLAVSCSDRIVVPVDTVAIHRDTPRIDPPALTMNVGDQVTLKVSSLPGDVWRWTSSNSNVVTVDQTGVVHGVSVGNATVTARLTSDTTVFANAAVVVNSAITCGQALTIISINSAATGSPANLAALAGAIDVRFNLNTVVGGTAILVIRRASGDTTVASVPGPSSAPDCSAVLRWDTAARGPAGNSLFPNGTYALLVRFTTSSGTTVSTTTQQVIVANP